MPTSSKHQNASSLKRAAHRRIGTPPLISETLIWREIDGWWSLVVEAIRSVRQRDGVRAAPRERVLDLMAPLLQERFAEVRLYHGCRPVDVGLYYREGIRRHGPFILDRAREIYRLQGIPEHAIEAAIADTDFEVDKDRVFLALDDEPLIATAGHYMIYGSEAVMSVGAALMRLGCFDAQRKLMTVGQPTLLTCDVPLSLLREHSVREIAESLYDEYRLARGRQPRRPSRRDHTVVVRNDIPATSIRCHTTPTVIPDWHRNGLPYRFVARSDERGTVV